MNFIYKAVQYWNEYVDKVGDPPNLEQVCDFYDSWQKLLGRDILEEFIVERIDISLNIVNGDIRRLCFHRKADNERLMQMIELLQTYRELKQDFLARDD